MTLPLTYEVFPRSGRLEGVDRLTSVLEDGLVNVLMGGTVEGPLRPPDGGGVVFTLRWRDDAGEVLLLGCSRSCTTSATLWTTNGGSGRRRLV